VKDPNTADVWAARGPSIFTAGDGRRTLQAHASNGLSNSRTLDAKRASGKYVDIALPNSLSQNGPKPKPEPCYFVEAGERDRRRRAG
jgi:hypothetical protein